MTRTLFVCTNYRPGLNGSCAGAGSVRLLELLAAEVAARGLDWQVTGTRCLAWCSEGPNVKAAPDGPMLHHCRAEEVAALVDRLEAEWQPVAAS